MIPDSFKTRLSFALVLCALASSIAFAVSAQAVKTAPVKLVLGTERIGKEVHEVGFGCGEAGSAECLSANPSSKPGGFTFPTDVAVAENGNIYVADNVNRRIQELDPSEPSGKQFLLTFGKEVNKGGGDTCTKAEENQCGAGVAGSSARAFAEPQDVVVEPGSGDVYVLDLANWRVEKYTATGEFLLMFGKEVNADGSDICTKAEENECRAGVRADPESTESSAFDFIQGRGDLLAIGGPGGHTLYVGDAHRVQEFNPSGGWEGEIRLSSATIAATPQGQISQIAVNAETVFVVYQFGSTVHEFEASTGKELAVRVEVAPRIPGSAVQVGAMALDQSGHLAVSAEEESPGIIGRNQFGTLYEVSTGHKLTLFTVPGLQGFHGVNGISFDASGELQAIVAQDHDIMSYTPKPVAELVSLLHECVPGAEHETDVTFDCTLHGELDPWGVLATMAWFQWGKTSALGQQTEAQPVTNVGSPPIEGEEEPSQPISAVVKGVRPNEPSFYYRIVGTDQNAQLPELLTGESVSFATPAVPPKIVGNPSTPFVASTSAVMFGELNPENANTTYEFQYGQFEPETCATLEACPGRHETAPLQSAAYRKIGVTGEATNLRPDTRYLYRLFALGAGGAPTNEKGESVLPEGEFTTLPAPRVRAETGASTSVTSTSAIISGTVDPDGQASTYTFELGLDNGASTYYAVVASGPTDAGSGFVPKSLLLSGLQPGTRYAYRIAVHFGDGSTPGSSAIGAPQSFTTAGVASVLAPPPPTEMLPIPPIHFPPPEKALSNAQKLAKALKACKKKPKRQRSSCERHARKLYGVKSKINNKKKSSGPKARQGDRAHGSTKGR